MRAFPVGNTRKNLSKLTSILQPAEQLRISTPEGGGDHRFYS